MTGNHVSRYALQCLYPREWLDLTLDGEGIEGMGLFLEAARLGAVPLRTTYTAVPGRNGAVDQTLQQYGGRAFFDSRPVEFDLFTVGSDEEVFDAKRRLAALHGRRISVHFGKYPGEFRGRCSVGRWDDARTRSNVTLALAADPFLYGPERTVALVKGSNSFRVLGNVPAYPIIETRQASGARTLKVLNEVTGDYVQLSATFNGSKVLTIDMGHSACSLAGTYVPVDLASDFFAVEGEANVSLSYGSATLSYTERWTI